MDFRARGFKAHGGLMRFGFDEGGKDLSEDPNYKGWLKLYEKNPDAAAINENHEQYLNFYKASKNQKAGGGFPVTIPVVFLPCVLGLPDLVPQSSLVHLDKDFWALVLPPV